MDRSWDWIRWIYPRSLDPNRIQRRPFSIAFSFFTWPTLAIMGAALASVYGWVLLRIVVKNQETSPLMANGISMFLGGVLALGHSFFVESWNPLPVQPGQYLPLSYKSQHWMALLFNILCYNLYGGCSSNDLHGDFPFLCRTCSVPFLLP